MKRGSMARSGVERGRTEVAQRVQGKTPKINRLKKYGAKCILKIYDFKEFPIHTSNIRMWNRETSSSQVKNKRISILWGRGGRVGNKDYRQNRGASKQKKRFTISRAKGGRVPSRTFGAKRGLSWGLVFTQSRLEKTGKS